MLTSTAALLIFEPTYNIFGPFSGAHFHYRLNEKRISWKHIVGIAVHNKGTMFWIIVYKTTAWPLYTAKWELKSNLHGENYKLAMHLIE